MAVAICGLKSIMIICQVWLRVYAVVQLILGDIQAYKTKQKQKTKTKTKKCVYTYILYANYCCIQLY